jgi:hypothetical protein
MLCGDQDKIFLFLQYKPLFNHLKILYTKASLILNFTFYPLTFLRLMHKKDIFTKNKKQKKLAISMCKGMCCLQQKMGVLLIKIAATAIRILLIILFS